MLPFLHVRSTARLRSPQRALQPVDRRVREQNQLLVLQGHLIRSVFKRLVLKVWETVVYYMWNWLVPSCPRHNYITERCMPVRGSLPPAFTTRGRLDTWFALQSPVEATVPDELDDIGGGTGGHGHKRRGSIMRWLGKKMRSTKKRRAKADEMALQPHQVYIMNQAYPALVRYFSAKGTLFPESVLSGVAAPLSDLLALYDVAPDRLFAEMGTLISQVRSRAGVPVAGGGM